MHAGMYMPDGFCPRLLLLASTTPSTPAALSHVQLCLPCTLVAHASSYLEAGQSCHSLEAKHLHSAKPLSTLTCVGNPSFKSWPSGEGYPCREAAGHAGAH
jgi:hypothetical protein